MVPKMSSAFQVRMKEPEIMNFIHGLVATSLYVRLEELTAVHSIQGFVAKLISGHRKRRGQSRQDEAWKEPWSPKLVFHHFLNKGVNKR